MTSFFVRLVFSRKIWSKSVKITEIDFWSNFEKNETFFKYFQTRRFGLEVMMKKEEMHNKKPHEFSNITFFLSFQLSNCTEERKRNFFPCTYFLGQQKDWERIKMQNTYLFHRKFITTNKVNSGGQTLKLSRLLCCTVSKKIEKYDL